MSATDGIWGQNGYPQQVPGTNWAAVSVWDRSELTSAPFFTDIYPHMDDPHFVWRTVENSPWFTAKECEAINKPHRKIYWKKEARTFTYDPDAVLARKRAADLLKNEPQRRAAWIAEQRPEGMA